jgi:polysaccharide export outer membrane protein
MPIAYCNIRIVALRYLVLGPLFFGLSLCAADFTGPASASHAGATNSQTMTLTSMARLDDAHKLVPGDRLSFRVLEDEEDARLLMVKDSGQIDAPYVGLFPAANRTCKQLAYELKRELEKDYYFQATVIVAIDQFSGSRGKVYLVGAVRGPGPQEIPSDEIFTVGKAVMRAGGFADFADKRRVRITRRAGGAEEQPDVIIVNVADVIEKGRTEHDVELMPGDIVIVKERSINF